MASMDLFLGFALVFVDCALLPPRVLLGLALLLLLLLLAHHASDGEQDRPESTHPYHDSNPCVVATRFGVLSSRE